MINDIKDYSKQHRLHPLSMFYRGITNLPQIIFPLYLALVNHDSQEMIFIIITIAVALFTFPTIFLNYYYFLFWINPTEIVIHSGIIARKKRNIPMSRVQNVEINQNFLQRILGLAKVSIETAGDAQTEGLLEFVTIKDAEIIRNIIREYQQVLEAQITNNIMKINKFDDIELTASLDNIDNNEKINTSNNIYNNEYKDDLIFQMSLKEIFIFGMTKFRPVVLVIVFVLMQYINYLPKEFYKNETQGISNFFAGLNPFYLVLYISIIILIAILISWAITIFLTINQYYGFRLHYDGKRLHNECGLFGKRNGIIPLKKLQAINIVSNIISRKLNLYGLQMQTAGLGVKKLTPEIAVPAAKLSRVVELANNILNFNLPEKYNPVSRHTIKRALFRYFMILTPLIIISAIFLPEALFALLLTPLLYFAAVLMYQNRGWLVEDDKIIIKEGFIFQKISIIPISKIQTLSVRSTFFQGRLGLATMFIDTAATSVINDAAIIDIDIKEAELIMNHIAECFHKQ